MSLLAPLRHLWRRPALIIALVIGIIVGWFAARALEFEPQIGALLPCNVVVRVDAAGKTVVEFMDPNAVLKMVDRPEVNAIAAEVRARLVRVMEAL